MIPARRESIDQQQQPSQGLFGLTKINASFINGNEHVKPHQLAQSAKTECQKVGGIGARWARDCFETDDDYNLR